MPTLADSSPRSRCPTTPSIPPPSHTKQPGGGFYLYVNGTWQQSTTIPKWYSEYGLSEEVDIQINKSLLKSINRISNNKSEINLNPSSDEEHLHSFLHIWKTSKPESEESYLKICQHLLMESRSESDIAKWFGWLCRSGISSVIRVVAQEEITPPYFVRSSFTPGKLTLPTQYYLELNLQTTDVWKSYIQYISTCSIELGLPFLIKVIDAEKAIAKILDSPSRILAKTVSGKSLTRWVSDFPWSDFMEGLDMDSHWQTQLWLLDSPDILKKLFGWFCKADSEEIIAVLIFHFITFSSNCLRPSIQAASTALFEKALKGAFHTPPKQMQLLNDVKTVLPDALCNIYSDEQHDTKVIAHMNDIVSKFKTSAAKIMANTTMFPKKIKSRAVEKIHRMKFEIGKGPPTPLPKVSYNPESLLHTIISIQSARVAEMRKITGKPSSHSESSYPCFQVNASYYPESNYIIIPWGILQWPYYCQNAPLGWNHGGIGATIGHEMTHAFDMEGSMYSPRAQFKNWWTRKARQQFIKQTRKVAKFYTRFQHYGKHLNGRRTLSEDWADLGGIRISLDALKMELDDRKSSDEERKNAYKQFFISYATSWRTLARKKKAIFAMMTSVHSLAEDRVDRIVPQFQEWVDAFDVRPTDTLYIEPSKRLAFF